MKTCVGVLLEREKGKHYRLYAGIRYPDLPCKATLTKMEQRLIEELYNDISHDLVEIVQLLGFLSYKILATDGTLFPASVRYKGCTYFCDEYKTMDSKGLIDNVCSRIFDRLTELVTSLSGEQ